MADPEGVQGVCWNPPFPSPLPFFNFLWKWNNLFSLRPNYFIFIGYLRKKWDKISKANSTELCIIQKFWIRPWGNEFRVYEPTQETLVHCTYHKGIKAVCWEIFHAFVVVCCWHFFKINFLKKFFQEHNQSVKRFGSMSGPTFCQSWSGSILFVKVIKSPLTSNCLNWHPVGLVVLILVWVFIYSHTLYMWLEKILTSLHIFTGLPESLLLSNVSTVPISPLLTHI